MDLPNELNSFELPTYLLCFFFNQNNDKVMLPLQTTHYDVKIQNNFAEITSTQTYRNPFSKPLEVHYSIPTDPNFTISDLKVIYQNVIVEGVVKEKQAVKAEFKAAKDKG